jgi:O-succinylbenzoate synthase
MESIDEFLAALRVAVDAGYSRLELKFRPGWDISMLNVVRSEFPTQRLHVDIEGSMRLGHLEILCRLDDFCLAMVEQPLPPDDLVGHAMVQETIKTPVSLDESITTLAQAEMALDLHSGQYVNLKPGRVGGLTPALAIHDLCHENCIPCWVGAAPQSALGARIGYALAAKPNCSYPADYLPAEELLADDLAPPLLPVRSPGDGKLRIPLWTEPGLGIEPDARLLEKCTLAQARVTASPSA